MTTPLPTYTQSYEQAQAHARGFVQATIGEHPVAAAVVMALLVVLVLVLGFYVAHYRSQCAKSGFQIGAYSNLTGAGMNPEWQLGSMDAGNWGPVHREPTAWNVAAWHPEWRAGQGFGRDGFAGGAAVATGPGPRMPCAKQWDPAALAEVQALSTLGTYPHESLGEYRFQRAVDGASGGGSALSDEQLTTLMHQGGAP